jgi:hypothetical protein
VKITAQKTVNTQVELCLLDATRIFITSSFSYGHRQRVRRTFAGSSASAPKHFDSHIKVESDNQLNIYLLNISSRMAELYRQYFSGDA